MDSANLPFAYLAITLFGSLMFAGVGLAIGSRVLPHFKLHRSATKNVTLINGDLVSPEIAGETGRLLPTEILGLEANIVRYRDGSFGKAYSFEPANTLYDDGRLTEQRIEDLNIIVLGGRPANLQL